MNEIFFVQVVVADFHRRLVAIAVFDRQLDELKQMKRVWQAARLGDIPRRGEGSP